MLFPFLLRRYPLIGHWTVTSCICMSWLREWAQWSCVCVCALWKALNTIDGVSAHPSWMDTANWSSHGYASQKAYLKPTVQYEHEIKSDAVPELGFTLDAGAWLSHSWLAPIDSKHTYFWQFYPLSSENMKLSSAYPSVVLQWSCQNSNWPIKSTYLRKAPNTTPLTRKRTEVKHWFLLYIFHMPWTCI